MNGTKQAKILHPMNYIRIFKERNNNMEFSLDKEEQQELKMMILSTIQNALKKTDNGRPYLNRKEIAKYFGVAESTIGYWASLGMPVAVIDGRKLYGKQSITQWLKDHEKPSIKHREQTKSPLPLTW